MITETDNFPTFASYIDFERRWLPLAIATANGGVSHLPRDERRRCEKAIHKKIVKYFSGIRTHWAIFHDQQGRIVGELSNVLVLEGE